MKICKAAVAAATASLALISLSACSSILNPTAEGSITVYSNSISDGRGDWLIGKARDAGFELNLVDVGGGDAYNKLVAEKDNPVADVVFGLNQIYYTNLSSQGILQEYTPSWSEEVEPGIGDDKSYWPIVREPIMLTCNSAVYPTEAEMPQDWTDLWQNEKFWNRYEVPAGLGGGTTQVVISSILSRYPDPNGKLGVSEEGWKNIAEYFEHGSRSVDGTDLYARIAQGDVDCGQMWLAGKVTREEQYGVKTEAVSPKIGVPMLHQYVALIDNDNTKAKEFIDWFGSAEIQGEWSQEFATAPDNTKAEGDAEVVAFTDSFTAQDIDWAFVVENLPAWIEEIELNYVK